MSKPKASETTWVTIWKNTEAVVCVSEEVNDYFKIVIFGKRPKYFYGETAWSDTQRYVADETGDLRAWSIFA